MKWKEIRDAFKVDWRSEAGFLGAIGALVGKIAPSIFGGAASALGGGLVNKLMGGGDEGSYASGQEMPAFQQYGGQYLSNLLQKYGEQYRPGEAYTGQLSAPMSSYEQSSMGMLDKILGSAPTGELYGAASQHLMDTLGGKYADPSTSPYIQAQEKYAQQQLQDAINQSRLGQGARGTFYHSKALEEERGLQERTQNYLNTLIGDFIQQERGMQMGAVPMAQEMEKYGRIGAPLALVEAGQTYGSLGRTLEQADLERQYSEWQRQQGSLANMAGIAEQLYGANPRMQTTYTPPSQPGILNQVLGGAIGGAMPKIGDWLGDIFKPKSTYQTTGQLQGMNPGVDWRPSF